MVKSVLALVCAVTPTSTATPTVAPWTSALKWLGANPSTPILACQGDCDTDANCAGASKCIQRTGGTPAAITGCTVGDSGATARKDTDYCNNPVTVTWTNALTWLGDSPTGLKACQGDCDTDANCPGASKCIQRTAGTPAAVTGCTVGDSGATARKDDDYCSNPVWTNALEWLGDSPTGLKACQGDCDTDANCPGDSKCIQRTAGAPAAVAGCTVGDSGATARKDDDYCTNPATTTTTTVEGNSSSSAAGLHAWPVVTGTAVALAISVSVTQ